MLIRNNIKQWLDSGTKIRVLVFALLCVSLSLLFFRDFWQSLPYMLSPGRVFGENHAAPWGVLVLCLLFLWAKRGAILDAKNWERKESALSSVLVGVVLATGAVFVPPSGDGVVFRVLLAWLGVFVAVFGRTAARIPALLLTIYCFVITFPLAIYHFAEAPYTTASVIPLKALLNLLGFPLQSDGQIIAITGSSSESVSAFVSGGCAGPATMAVFLALFTLMMLDTPLKGRKAIRLFLVGIVGTWLQSYLRLVILMLTAYYLGRDAMWAAHSWTIYVLFPLWYLLFACIYFRQVKKPGLRGLNVGQTGNMNGENALIRRIPASILTRFQRGKFRR
jgi:exosortase/archaeosortase family protein